MFTNSYCLAKSRYVLLLQIVLHLYVHIITKNPKYQLSYITLWYLNFSFISYITNVCYEKNKYAVPSDSVYLLINNVMKSRKEEVCAFIILFICVAVEILLYINLLFVSSPGKFFCMRQIFFFCAYSILLGSMNVQWKKLTFAGQGIRWCIAQTAREISLVCNHIVH